jgi:DnaJ family protein C protein 17
MPSDDLIEHAKSSTDYYQLLGIETESSSTEIQRAYRKAALKYHPDKASKDEDPQAIADKFHLLKIASEVLSDPSAKAVYDQGRAAKILKRQNDEALSGFKRKMKEDLEQREGDARQRSGKRPFYGTEETSNAQQRHLQELAREGEQRRKERTEAKRKAMLDDGKQFEKPIQAQERDPPASLREERPAVDEGGDDTIQVRWNKKGSEGAFNDNHFIQLFEKYGKIENVIVRRKKGREGRNSSGRAMIVFASSKSANRAIEDIATRPDGIIAVRLASQAHEKEESEDTRNNEHTDRSHPKSAPSPSNAQGVPASKPVINPAAANTSEPPSNLLGSAKGKTSETDVLARLRLAAKKRAAEQNQSTQGITSITMEGV